MAATYHPAWKCSPGARKLHGRNMYQILGPNLDSPADLVVCWTKDGGPTGGTGQVIRIAMAKGIKIINLFNPEPMNAPWRLHNL